MADRIAVPDIGQALGIYRQVGLDADNERNRNALLALREQGVDLQREGLGIQREGLGIRRTAADRAASNADRLFGLQSKQFEQSSANADRQFDFTRSQAERDFDLRSRALNAKLSEPPKKTATIQNYEHAVANGFEGSPFEYQKQLAMAKAGPKPLTEAQAKAANFAERMLAAEKILDDPKITEALLSRKQGVFGAVPFIGGGLQSKESQTGGQAKEDFVTAVLRRESGAVISDSEFDREEKKYFPQPGDKPATIKQKAAARKRAIKGILRAAGPAAEGITAPGSTDQGDVISFEDYFKGQ